MNLKSSHFQAKYSEVRVKSVIPQFARKDQVACWHEANLGREAVDATKSQQLQEVVISNDSKVSPAAVVVK